MFFHSQRHMIVPSFSFPKVKLKEDNRHPHFPFRATLRAEAPL